MYETWETKLSKKEQYEWLLNLMKAWQQKYDEGHPIISDMEWDDYYTTLLRLEKELGYADPESPSQKIHYDVVNELKKVEHNHPMLSLDKTKDINEIYDFIMDKDAICMAKLDGLTCSLHYRGGRLVRAETRGNGLVGEDITHNAYKLPSIPKTIDSTYDTVVDGEIICTYENFEKFNTEYSNPRNFASGSIRLLDSNECAKRSLIFVAWDMINGYDKFNEEDIWDSTLEGKLRALEHLGFTVVPRDIPLFEYGESWEDSIRRIKILCEKLSYPIDGLVFKYNICKEYDAAGRTEHHFKGGLAYKFYDELYETELVDIEWSMGRTGVLTPIAIFKEIEIEGAKINRASLHNLSVMHELLSQPFKGQKIRIFRANQIIPQVYDAEDSHLTVSEFHISCCPVCGEPLFIKNNDGVMTLNCINENCEGKTLNRLIHFCGKKGLDIKGLSEATLEKLMDWGWVEKITDIFKLTSYRDEWINKPGFGVKSVDKILMAIEESKNCTFAQFLSSLGIPLIGVSVAKELAKKFYSYTEFRDAIIDGYPFYQLPNFGEAKHRAIIDFDYSLADAIYLNVLNITNENQNNNENLNQSLKDKSLPLQGKIFVITGHLQLIQNRQILSNIVEQNGGKITGSVSSKTTALVNNDVTSTSQKNQKAKQLGIPIITEEELLQMCNYNLK